MIKNIYLKDNFMSPIHSYPQPEEKTDNSKFISNIKEVRIRAQTGENKWQIFEEFKDKIDSKILAGNLANVPDKNLAEKYSGLNNFFIALLVILGLSGILTTISLLLESSIKIPYSLLHIGKIIFAIVFIYLSRKKHGEGYFLCSLLMAIGFSNSFAYAILPLPFSKVFLQYSLWDKSLYIGQILLVILIITMGLIIRKKMFPYYNLFKKKYDKEEIPIFTTENLPKNEQG